jgi:tRNA pseudouridine38-40 synthase
MVRRMVGVLAAIGRGDFPAAQIDVFLQRPSDTPARLTAPASGLFLERVFYPGDSRHLPLIAAVPVRRDENGPQSP